MRGAFVILFLAAAVASVCAQYGNHGLEGLGLGGDHHQHLEEYVDYRGHPKYHYNYAVHDPHHHDIKSQHEVRDGHETKGRYELLQPDGRKRIVEYTAGKHGADYKVKYEGKAYHGDSGHYGGY